MYQFSRAIYRELAPYITESRPDAGAASNHKHVLDACESAVERLATDRHYFAKPARTLFYDIRTYFPMGAQERVLQTVCRYMGLAQRFLGREPVGGARGRDRRAAHLPRDDAQGLDLPARAVAAQRVLPLPPAPGRHRAQRAPRRQPE